MEKQALLDEICTAHDQLAATIEHLSDEQLLEPAMDDWTGKDLLAHIASWHDHSARVIAELRAGRAPYDRKDPAHSVDAINERTRREHAHDSSAETRRAFHDSFVRLLMVLEPITDDELFSSDHWAWLDGDALAETILWDTSRHYADHGANLERLQG